VPGVGKIAIGFAGFAFTHAGAWLMIALSHDGLLLSLLWLAAFGCCRTRRQCFHSIQYKNKTQFKDIEPIHGLRRA
jgi:hypothetical protein